MSEPQNENIQFVDQQPPPQQQGEQIQFLDQPQQQAPSWQPRLGTTFLDAIKAGYQSSGTGLTLQGRLPDVVMDPHSEGWYHPFNTLAKGVSQLVSDAPEMFGGIVAGAAAGSEVPVIGNVIGGGIGAFAVPAAFRKALMLQYSQGSVSSVADFLERTAIVGSEAAKQGLVGGLTAGVGPLAQGALEPLAGATTAALGAKAAEIGAMTLAPAALEGKLPEPQDIFNAAILVGGLHAVGMVSGNLRSVYEKTGLKPDEVVAMAKQDPVLAQELQEPMGPAGVPKTLEPQANAEAIKSAVPGALMTAADKVAAVSFFGPHVPIVDGATHINFEYLATSTQMDGALEEALNFAQAEVDRQTRGVVSDPQAEQNAVNAMALLVNPDGTVAVREPGSGVTDTEIKARGAFVQGAIVSLAKVTSDYAALDNPTPEQDQAFLESVTRVSLAQAAANLEGAKAESGRALRANQDVESVSRVASLVLDALNKSEGSPKELATMLKNIDTPEGVARLVKQIAEPTWQKMGFQQKWNALVEGFRACLIGPVAFAKKAISDGVMAAIQVADTAVARPIDAVQNYLRTGSFETEMAANEPLAQSIGMYRGTANAVMQTWGQWKLQAAKVAATEGLGNQLRAAGDVIFSDVPREGFTETKGAIPGRTGEVIRTLGFGPIEAITNLAKNMQANGEAYRLAGQQLAAEGGSIFTHEGQQRLAELAQRFQSTDLEHLEQVAKERTFTADMGPVGKAVQKAVEATHTEPIVPFIKTPLNLFEQAIRHSPFALLDPGFWADVKGGGQVSSRRIAEAVVGTGLGTLALSYAAAGHLSGSGDPDQNKRRLDLAAGWQPYSLQIGDKWYSYRQIHPVGTLLGMAADVQEMSKYMSADESDKAGKVLINAFAHAVTEQTFLKGMDEAIHVMDDPVRYGGRWLQNTAASLVPAVASQTAMMVHQDPYKRQIDSIKDAVMARIPGLRESLQPQRDPFGQPVPNDTRLGIVSPVNVTTPSTDLVRTEAARLSSIGNGLGAPAVPRSVELPNAGQRDVGKVPLSPEQRDLFGDVSGHLAYSIMEDAVADPRWATLPDAVKQTVFKQAFARGHQLGAATALSPQERQAEVQRIVGGLAQRFQQPSQ